MRFFKLSTVSLNEFAKNRCLPTRNFLCFFCNELGAVRQFKVYAKIIYCPAYVFVYPKVFYEILEQNRRELPNSCFNLNRLLLDYNWSTKKKKTTSSSCDWKTVMKEKSFNKCSDRSVWLIKKRDFLRISKLFPQTCYKSNSKSNCIKSNWIKSKLKNKLIYLSNWWTLKAFALKVFRRECWLSFSNLHLKLISHQCNCFFSVPIIQCSSIPLYFETFAN